VRQHRQKFVLAARFAGQLLSLLGDALLQRNALGNVADVALGDQSLVLVIDVGDDFDLGALAVQTSDRQMFVAQIFSPQQLADRLLAIV